MQKISSFVLWLKLALLASGIPVCSGQAVRATLVGRVTDQSGAIVPATKITIVNTGTNESRSAVVGENGEFVFTQLAPGSYTMTAEHEGFRKDIRSGIVLEVGQEARIDIALQVGALAEKIEVEAAAPL